MNNLTALSQLRKASSDHIAQNPETIVMRRTTDAADPFARTATVTYTGRLSHERAGVKVNQEFPSGLDTALTLYLQSPWNIAPEDGEIISARGKAYKAGPVDPLKRYGGVHCNQSPLYPAGDSSGWVTGITVSGSDPEALAPLGTLQLTATIAPLTAVDLTVIWTSSDVGVVTVDSTGLVTAVGLGVATVTAMTRDGSFTDTRNFEVGT